MKVEQREQVEREKRVQSLLIDVLLRQGLGRPTTVTKAGFEEMRRDLCARLAYMSADGLGALAEHCAARAGGPRKDRFPIAKDILHWAAVIEVPSASASPLIRKVLRADLGGAALRGGWAFELIAWLRKNRQWPNAWAAKGIRERGEKAAAQVDRFAGMLARGQELPPGAQEWLDRRASAQDVAAEIRKGGA